MNENLTTEDAWNIMMGLGTLTKYSQEFKPAEFLDKEFGTDFQKKYSKLIRDHLKFQELLK